MKIGKVVLILIMAFGLISCKGSTKETETKIPVSGFDLSGIETTIFPKPIGIINDYGQIFTESQQTELSKILYDYDSETTRQIVVVTIDSIKPYNDIQKYAVDLGSHWGVGTDKEDNGLAIVICNPCEQIGIATGYGTELILTDEICKEILEKTIIPEFKNDKYYDGIKKGIMELIEKWK